MAVIATPNTRMRTRATGGRIGLPSVGREQAGTKGAVGQRHSVIPRLPTYPAAYRRHGPRSTIRLTPSSPALPCQTAQVEIRGSDKTPKTPGKWPETGVLSEPLNTVLNSVFFSAALRVLRGECL